MIDVNWDENSKAAAMEFACYIGKAKDCERYFKHIAPKTKTVADAVEWNGEGLPPIGIECEIKHKDATKEWAQPDFHKETVKTYGDELFIIAGRNGNRETVGVINDYFFRPIKPKMSEETVSKLREYPKWCLGRKAGLVSDLIEEFISEHDII